MRRSSARSLGELLAAADTPPRHRPPRSRSSVSPQLSETPASESWNCISIPRWIRSTSTSSHDADEVLKAATTAQPDSTRTISGSWAVLDTAPGSYNSNIFSNPSRTPQSQRSHHEISCAAFDPKDSLGLKFVRCPVLRHRGKLRGYNVSLSRSSKHQNSESRSPNSWDARRGGMAIRPAKPWLYSELSTVTSAQAGASKRP